MKAKPLKLVNKAYERCSPDQATHVMLRLPGPLPNRILPVIIKGKREGTACWSWNGSVDAPTLKPSIRSRAGRHLCHSFVNDGRVQFLNDCSHEYAGQTMDLLDVE